MLHADFSRILDLLDRAAADGRQTRSRHGTGHADLALTTDLGTGNGGVFLVEHADGAAVSRKVLTPSMVLPET